MEGGGAAAQGDGDLGGHGSTHAAAGGAMGHRSNAPHHALEQRNDEMGRVGEFIDSCPFGGGSNIEWVPWNVDADHM